MGVTEQQRLIDFMDAGNAVYFSGVNIATDHNGTEFWNRFGASYQSILEDIPSLLGEEGTFTEGLHLEYQNQTDPGRYNDFIGEAGGEIVFRSQDNSGRVVINSTDVYRTIASTIILGAVTDQDGIARKENVMRLYLSHLLDINQPQFWCSEESIILPDVIPGGTVETTIYIQNTGKEDLDLFDITMVGDGYNISSSDDITLSYGSYQAYTITLNPDNEGVYTGYVSFSTNDPDNETVMISVVGNSVGVPIMEISLDYINAETYLNGTTQEIITISNIGGGYLDYHLDFQSSDQVEYLWRDSNMESGPEFVWEDISNVGINLELGGLDSYVNVDLPFPFVFYGQAKTSMKISTNGYLTFGIDGTDYSNDIIPGSLEPDDLIAVFWDDLRSTADSDAYTWYDNNNQRFIIQYTNWQVNVSGGEGDMNFQVHLYPNGDIYFYYLSMIGRLTSATVGLENFDHTTGTMVVYNDDYLEDELAIYFTHNESWLSVENHLGTVPFMESQDVIVNFDASGLEVGYYFTNLVIRTNEIDSVPITVPIEFIVSSTYNGSDVIPNNIVLNQNYPNPFNPVTSISFELTKTGLVKLLVYNIKGHKIRTLVDYEMPVGHHKISWNGTDDNGSSVSSGIYFYKMKSGKYTSTKKMILMK